MGSRLGRRVVNFANIPIKLLMPTSFSNITEIALKTIPSASKIEIKRVLESLYGFEVDEVRTLNMDGKRKKRGGLLIAKPDYKKAYVTLRNPLSISPDLYPIRVIEEERKNIIKQSKQSKQSKSTIVEGEETKKTHWLDGGGVKKQTGYGGKVWHRVADRQGSGGNTNVSATAKFPWTSMRSSAR